MNVVETLLKEHKFFLNTQAYVHARQVVCLRLLYIGKKQYIYFYLIVVSRQTQEYFTLLEPLVIHSYVLLLTFLRRNRPRISIFDTTSYMPSTIVYDAKRLPEN